MLEINDINITIEDVIQVLTEAGLHPEKIGRCINQFMRNMKSTSQPERRILNTISREYSVVEVVDTPVPGGICHEYLISNANAKSSDNSGVFGFVNFQKGPVSEEGVNGCFMEDLLAIVIDRLELFQSGEYACRENALALTKIEEAMHWLNHRSNKRRERNVEGTSII